MIVIVFLLLSVIITALCACLGSLPVWGLILILIGCFAGFHALYMIFYFICNLWLDTSKPIEKQKKIYRFASYTVGQICCFWGNVHYRVEGIEKLPKDTRFLFVSNHRSAYDPLVAQAALWRYNICFISKPSNLKIPIIGKTAYGAGYLPIDRDNDRNALRTILTGADYLKRDICSMGIYPEGTRSRDGNLLPFHAGSFKMAQKANVPIVISCITGTEKMHGRSPLLPTRVLLQILDVIPADQVKASSTTELAERTKNCIARALQQ